MYLFQSAKPIFQVIASVFFSLLFSSVLEAAPKKKLNPIATAKKIVLSADEIIKRMDKNQIFGTRKSLATMRIKKRGIIRKKKMKIISRGAKTSFTEFLYPSRDKGVKYLRLNDNLWMYLPSAEKTIKISGHMLRQSMMGSDFSYEDMLENGALRERYNVVLLKSEKQNGHDCYLLKLTQKKRGETYPTRKIWVDKTLFVPRRSDMYSLSGRLIKSMTFGKIKRFGSRNYPTYMKMENKLRSGTWTEVLLTKIVFKVKLADRIFTLQNLQSED